MAELILKTEEEIDDLVVGATFYGTGGGGDSRRGIAALESMRPARAMKLNVSARIVYRTMPGLSA